MWYDTNIKGSVQQSGGRAKRLPRGKGLTIMKKLACILLTVLLLCVLCVPCFAASSVAVDVAAVISEDGLLTLTLTVPEGSGLATFETTLHYDAETLELQDVAYGAGNMTTSNTETAGKVGLFMVWSETQETAATLATVTFQLKDGASGTTDFVFTDTSATDNDDNALGVSIAGSGTLTVPLTEEQTVTDADIPSTAGKYVAIGGVAAAAIAVIVVAAAFVKRKRAA